MIFLLDHDHRKFGASKFLLELWNQIKNLDTIFYVTPLPMDHIPKYNVLFYYYQVSILQEFINLHNPSILYINSWNHVFQDLKCKGKRIIFHSHETIENYPHDLLQPDYVVSSLIANEYKTKKNILPKVQPPFLSMKSIYTIFESANIPPQQIIHSDKITFGMCGEVSYRKNFPIFIELARMFPRYQFIWIGCENKYKFTVPKNLFIIAFTENPYQYFYHCIDYFILTSTRDPCPYVILENIVLETPIILFDKSILTKHYDSRLDFIYNVNDYFNIKSGMYGIYKFGLKKKQKIQDLGKGAEYIKEVFGNANAVIDELFHSS